MAALAHQEVFQQHNIINQLIRGRFRWEREARVRRILRWPRLHPERSANLTSMISSMLSLKMKILERFKDSNWKFRSRFLKQHSWNRKPLDPSLKLATTLRHLHSGTKYSDIQYCWRVAMKTLPIVVREVCNAMCE